MNITLCNQSLTLLAEKAVLWKEALFVADVHLGKTAAFQKLGIPIPKGVMKDDLERLGSLIKTYNIKQCYILGDLIHASLGLTNQVINEMASFLHQTSCKFQLILGNHDRALIKQLPKEWNLELHLENHIVEPFCLSHHPVQRSQFVICGHIHPCYTIRSGIDALRLPCFQLTKHYLLLPAFSNFTGSHPVKKQDSKIFLISNDQVVPL